MHHDHSRQGTEPKRFWGSRYSIGLLVMGAVAAYFLFSEHRAHLLGALPYLLLLACPLMHLFMHHGHHGHGGHGASHRDADAAPPPSSSTGEQP